MKLDEIAQLAGVSRTTASYVINGKADQYRISQKTRNKVLAVVNKYGFHPNHGASSLRRGKTHTIGLVIPDLENKSYARLAKQLEHKARSHGYQLIISCTEDRAETEQAVVSLLISRKLDALITASCLPKQTDFYHRIQQRGTPVIAVDRVLDTEYFACITSEDCNGAYLLTSKLLDSNPSSIALVSACPALSISQQREKGFLKAIAEHTELASYKCYYGEQFAPETSRRLVEKWIKENSLPEAIVTTSFTLCEGILDVLCSHPEVINKTRLGTFGNHRFLDFLSFPVHSLPQPFENISDEVLNATMQAIEGNYNPGLVQVARDLVVRN